MPKTAVTGRDGLVGRLYSIIALTYFVSATLILMLLSLAILGIAIWDLASGFLETGRLNAVLDAAAVLIIGFAVMETANFIAEEEIVRKRELRSARESRRSMTKFVTILIIAMSLEALVMIFRTGKENIEMTIYPIALFAVSMLVLIALGAYQWLSSRVAADEEEAEEAEPGSG